MENEQSGKYKDEAGATGSVEAKIHPAIVGIAISILPLLFFLLISYIGIFQFTSRVAGFGLGSGPQELLVIISYIVRFLILLECFRRYFNEVLFVTTQGLVHKKGLLSLSCTTAAIQFSDIREVRVEQTLLERVFGFGTLKVGTASMKDYEVVFRRMANAQRFAKWLQKERIGDPLMKDSRD